LVKAVWNGTTIAESEETLVVEGNHYFPPDAVKQDYLRPSAMRSICLWKGLARYYTIDVGGARNANAAWSYPQPWPWIRRIKSHVAFWHGVEVRRD
jgi:uncharacterized protein (DUF427 family)